MKRKYAAVCIINHEIYIADSEKQFTALNASKIIYIKMIPIELLKRNMKRSKV